MKLLIKILALNCAFFCFKSYSADKIPAINEGIYTYECDYEDSTFRVTENNFSECEAVIKNGILVYGYFPSVREGFSQYQPTSAPTCSYRDLLNDGSNYFVTCSGSFESAPLDPESTESPKRWTSEVIGKLSDRQQDSESFLCPDPNYPNGPTEYNHEMWCYELEQELDPDCPAPTDSDPFVFGTGSGQTSICFPVSDGRQCEIKTDVNGGYYVPVSFGSIEPVPCTPDPEPEPDPEPTEPPDTRPPPEDTDPTVSPDTMGALNKVNKNLDSINKNMISGYESNDERLDRLAKETQNSNELLSSIKKNTLEDNDTLTDIKTGQANTNNLLEKIEKNTAPESFSFSANRKQGGLNDIFTNEDIQQIKTEIEEKQTEFNEYIETIKSESSSLFTLDTSIAGGYQEHKIVVKGVEIETGISRFSDFFKLISGAILLVATLTALYILLGKNG
ncbi:hypothetical protein L3Q70_05945 [Pseudoalteromonas sp. CF6-2]|uniref:hypothetical protein n=1 Tax=Pseudoalteromonas sp. CF6-2 TaxID=562716 RepID=UPI001F193B47|nr:hypothetical protein L3Q70_05945 [Pseudoalteromonas sp. CF6-2]